MAERGVRRYIEAGARNHRRQRHDATAETFAEHDNIRDDVVVLEGEEFSGAAERDGNLVEDQ